MGNFASLGLLFSMALTINSDVLASPSSKCMGATYRRSACPTSHLYQASQLTFLPRRNNSKKRHSTSTYNAKRNLRPKKVDWGNTEILETYQVWKHSTKYSLCRSEDTEDDDTKEAVDDDDLNPGKSDGGSVQNENSLSPPPQHPPTAGHVGAKKRHRSTESIDEIEVPSPKKPSQNPLGLPGANIRINSRGMS